MRDTSTSPRTGRTHSLTPSTARSRASARDIVVSVVLTALTPFVVVLAMSRPALAVTAAATVLAVGFLMHARRR